MSRGQSQPRNQPVRRVLERCKTRDTVEIIDVDKEKIDVVIVDAEETSRQGGSGTARRSTCPSVISIEDEDEGADDSFRNVHADATSSEFCPAPSNAPVAEESKSDEFLMTGRKRNPSSKSMEHVRNYDDVGPSGNCFGLGASSEDWSECDSSEYDSDESISSDSDSSDCEIIEDSSANNIREKWERAASMKKKSDRRRLGSEDQASASGSTADTGMYSGEETHSEIDIDNVIKKVYSTYSKEVPTSSCLNNLSSGKENLSSTMPAAAELGDSSWKRNESTTDLDVDGTTNLGHNGPEYASETCTRRAEPAYENLCNNLRSGSRDPETVLCTSICHLNMQHDPKINDDDASSHDKDEHVPVSTSVCGESSFLGKSGPCPVQSCPCKSQSWDGEQLTPVEYRKKHLPGQPSFSKQLQCDSIAPETAGFLEKEKSSFDEPSSFSCHRSDNLLNVGGTTPEVPPVCNTSGGSGTAGKSVPSDTGPLDMPQERSGLICERERHKESDEYRRAVEEEWAARQHQLQIQAEEAQRLKRKRKAETLRILDMERRQKERLEEIRESQKKNVETTNLKEHLRAEIRKDLDKMEFRYRDMASLLRGLGIHVTGGPFPMPREVNAAYKQALLRFHPDRASRFDIHQQVKAEETFKLISRLKEKLLPVM